MQETLKKSKKIIEKTKTISILPNQDFRKDSFPAALALFYSLKKLGKNVNLIAENYPRQYNFLVKKWKLNWKDANFLISIKEAEAKVLQLFYEKTENALNLFLKINGQGLKKENINLQPLNPKELLITVGIESEKEIEKFSKEKPKFLINIDNQLKNENYGQINLIELGTASFSEIVFDFIDSIDKNLFDKDVSEALLSGIILGTSNFQDPMVNSQTFQKLSSLIEKGADFKEIISKHQESNPNRDFYPSENSLRLFGKVVSKMNFLKEKNLGWVLLEKNNFSETNSRPLDLKFTLSRLNSSFFPFQNFFVLWQSENSPVIIRGVFYSQNKEYTQRILENFGGGRKGNGVLFQTEETILQKVKDDILRIL